MNCRSSGSLSELMVRINGFNSGMLYDDLEAIFCDPTRGSEKDGVNGFPNAIMLPKCDSVEQLSEVCTHAGRWLDDLYLHNIVHS